MSRGRRSGFGLVLGLALFFLMVAGMLALSLSQRGSGVTLEVRSAGQVARARQAALAALEELAFVVASRANAPPDPIATAFRDTAIRAGGAPVPLPVSAGADTLPAYHALVAPAYEDLALTRVSARLLGVNVFRTSSLPLHGELYGMLELTAEVSLGRRGSVTSRIAAQRWLEFKVLTPTVPPPFDRMRLAMEDPAGWATAHAVYDASQPALEDINRLLDEILLDFDEARQKIRELRATAQDIPSLGVGVDFKREIQDGTAQVERVLAGARDLETHWRTGPPQIELRYFFLPQLRYITGGDVEGEDVNLPGFLAELAPRRLVEWRSLDATRRLLGDQIRQSDLQGALETGKRSRTETLAQLATDIQLLTGIRKIQEAFVRRVGRVEVPRVFGPHLAVLTDAADNSYARDGAAVAVSAGRLTYAVNEPGVKAQLTALLRAYGGALSGIVVVRNPTEELVLTGADAENLLGAGNRLTLVVRGNLSVDGLAGAASGAGAGGGAGAAGATGGGVLCLIGHGRVRARGDLGASLIALGGFEPTGPLTVRGHLFLRDGPAGGAFAGRSDAEAVLRQIRIVEDPRIYAWDPARAEQIRPESLHVFIGPRVIHETAIQDRPVAGGGR